MDSHHQSDILGSRIMVPPRLPDINSEDCLRACLQSAPQRVTEATRVYLELDDQRQLLEQVSVLSHSSNELDSAGLETCLNIQPVKVDLTILFGQEWDIPERFDTFEDPSTGHKCMSLLPMPASDDAFLKIVTFLASTEPRVERITGGMGIGKTHGVFLAFLAALYSCEAAGFGFILDPIKALEKPEKLIEQLVVQMHAIDGEGLVKKLIPLHTRARKTIAVEAKTGIAWEALLICEKHCHSQGRYMMIVVDQENVLHRELAHKAHKAFVQDLEKSMCHVTVLINSESAAPLVAESAYASPSPIPLGIVATPRATALTFCKIVKSCTPEQNALLQEWIRFFGDRVAFLKAIHNQSRGCALETKFIVRHFSTTPTAGNEQDPFREFYRNSFHELVEKHEMVMTYIFANHPKSRNCKKMYALLMRFLDYHIEESPETAAAAGEWLWTQLNGLVPVNDRSKLLKYLQTMTDGRFMALEVNKTPRSLNVRANIVLKCLPKNLYINQSIAEALDSYSHGPFAHIAAFRGYILEQKMSSMFNTAISMQIKLIVKPKRTSSDDRMRALETETIRVWDRKIFFSHSINDDLRYLISNRDGKSSQWILLRPVSMYFPCVDFAILLLPEGTDPPVLFPIQVTENILTHSDSDKKFKHGRLDGNARLILNPLMEAFHEQTQGNGRVQFIWVGNHLKDVEEAANDKKFDENSFFTLLNDWHFESGAYFWSNEDHELQSSFAEIGYRCGDAVQAARASQVAAAAKLEEESAKTSAQNQGTVVPSSKKKKSAGKSAATSVQNQEKIGSKEPDPPAKKKKLAQKDSLESSESSRDASSSRSRKSPRRGKKLA